VSIWEKVVRFSISYPVSEMLAGWVVGMGESEALEERFFEFPM